MRFNRVALQAPHDQVDSLRDFYIGTLGLPARDESVQIGETELAFKAASGRPYYHFALLVPGNRFDAARQWTAERVDVLPGGDIDDVVFDFTNWDATALYFHDPAGNIVELIAHHGVEERQANGPFEASELLGVSELGLVGDARALIRGLSDIGILMWDGAANPERLAFLGERARTLIVAPRGRSWLPTGRPAESHPVEVMLTGATAADALIDSHRVVVRE